MELFRTRRHGDMLSRSPDGKKLRFSEKLSRLKERLKNPEWRRYGGLLLAGKVLGVAAVLFVMVGGPILLSEGSKIVVHPAYAAEADAKDAPKADAPKADAPKDAPKADATAPAAPGTPAAPAAGAPASEPSTLGKP